MTQQLRVYRVLLVLLISMTLGAITLMALGNQPPGKVPFCLSKYRRLAPLERAICPEDEHITLQDKWTHIEVFYSGTRAGNIKLLAALYGLSDPSQLNTHFVICNGLGEGEQDGMIQATDRWCKQLPIVQDPSRKNWYNQQNTIHICVIADGKNAFPTNSQIRRVESLVNTLCRYCHIKPECVYFPGDLVDMYKP